MWHELQDRGIRNNIFMLGTIDPDLKDFDVEKFNNMDREDPSFARYRQKISDEANANIWFYFREIAQEEVQHDGGTIGFQPFELTPERLMMLYLYQKVSFIYNGSQSKYSDLGYLFNYHTAIYGNEMILTNQSERLRGEFLPYFDRMICNNSIPFMLGSNQCIGYTPKHIFPITQSVMNRSNMEKFITDELTFRMKKYEIKNLLVNPNTSFFGIYMNKLTGDLLKMIQNFVMERNAKLYIDDTYNPYWINMHTNIKILKADMSIYDNPNLDDEAVYFII